MKKYLSFVVVVAMAWAGVVPAHAAPMMQEETPPFELSVISATAGFTGGPYQYVTGDVTYEYFDEDTTVIVTSTTVGHDTVDWLGIIVSIATVVEFVNVEAFPVTVFWYVDNGLDVTVKNYAGTIISENTTSGVLEVADQTYDRIMFTQTFPTTSEAFIGTTNAFGSLYISASPANECNTQFITLTEDSYTIDPTIESPLGPEGEPADDQIYGVTPGQYYRLYTYGSWNDGTSDSEDVAISWDGVEWTALSEMPPGCLYQLELDGQVVTAYYIIAESATFYIRANDTAAAFGDNTNNDPPITYAMGISVMVSSANCESQFDYSEEDWVASVQIHAEVNGTLATEDLEVGEWYAVEVASGTWQDEGAGAERTDMEFLLLASLTQSYTYIDLAGGSAGVWCQTTDGYITFIQASAEDLYLRVNNETGGFENNTGTLGVNIYHTTFTRTPEACETVFDISDLIDSGMVYGNQSGGQQFVYSVVDSIVDIGLEPGAWYYLETTGGPWTGHDLGSGSSYAMAVSEDHETWDSLSEWARGVCNIELDGFGHRGVYFQVPETEDAEWYLRVDDISNFFLNSGSMEWNLYGASRLNLELTPGEACDFTWSDDPLFGDSWVDATAEDGNPLYIYPTEATNFYAITIRGNDYYWQEETGGDPLYGVQVSTNDGETWSDFPGSYAGSLCTITTGHQTTTFVKVTNGQLWRIRVDSASFENNELGMGYWVFAANPGNVLDPWTACFDDASLFVINSLTFIPVKEEPGIYINGTNILAGGNQIQILQPTETYKLEINEGPWTNGEGSSSYSAAVSSDNGVTWYAIDDQENPDIICGDTDFTNQHRSIYFTVQEGQKWKIRVNDTEGDFLDNGGNLAYTLYSAYGDEDIPPVDVMVLPSVVNNVCVSPIVRPSSILDVSGWVNYARLSMQKYFAWCPNHTSIITALFNALKTKEPFASLVEGISTTQSVRQEMNSYEWSGEGEDFSILDKSPSESFEMFTDHAYAPIANDNPWETGVIDVDSFTDFDMPESYTACQEYLSPQAGSKLAQGVCYASAMMLMTGTSFWIQLILDIGILMLVLKLFFGEIAKVVAMATGVAIIQVSTGPTEARAQETLSRRGRR